MAQIANLTLKNYAAANVTLVPEKATPDGVSSWVDRSQGTFLGTVRASVTNKPNSDVNGARKVQVKLTYPTINVDGTLRENELFAGEFVLPNKGDLTARRELYARAKELVSSSVVAAAVHDAEFPW